MSAERNDLTEGAQPVSGHGPPTRLSWIDFARGVAILMVVFHHAVIFDEAIEIGSSIVTKLDNLLVSVRMPLFFVCAGLLGAKTVERGWGTTWTKRIGLFVWIYVIWSMIRFVVFSVIDWPLESSEAGTVSSLIQSAWSPSGTLWFIYALAIYFAVSLATARIPAYAVLAVSGVVSILFSSFVTTGDYEWDSILTYWFFFAIALRLRGQIIATVSGIGGGGTIFTLILLALLTGGSYLLDIQDSPGVRLLTGIFAVASMLFVSCWVTKLLNTRWLQSIGRQTLQVYLLHYFIIAVAVVYMSGALRSLPAAPLVVAVLLTTAATPLSIGVYRLTKRVPGLYAAPEWFVSVGHKAKAADPYEQEIRG
ncbi:acyltransferase family protein [Rhodococcus artemisiae]|uniref:Acyltransferase family protein n=1 Tax=Rhodococcus artemisiae TaxID=714159 RepID=A0ABU7LFR4_9NOCA|nr:acyltransferase family protein [Rhodococcus artemisiae]MEE2060394.1 acyltransferase family protein [Rhodococcus artemisiae]